MPKSNANRAIIVLEAPWELDPNDAGRTSVLPFVEGVAKLAGDTEVHYANFYDKKSFNRALDWLCKGAYKSRIVYIAAHGYKRKIEGIDIIDLLTSVAGKSKHFNITGVMLGSCFVGGNSSSMEVCLEGSRLRWSAGYACAASWLEATLVDCSLISTLSTLDADCFQDQDLVVQALADAIKLFSPQYHIGDDYHGAPMTLGDSLRFVVQPRGRGNRAKDVTELVCAEAAGAAD